MDEQEIKRKVTENDKILFSYTMKPNSLMKVETLTKSINAASRLIKSVGKSVHPDHKIDVFISDVFITNDSDGGVKYNVELVVIPKGAKLSGLKYSLPAIRRTNRRNGSGTYRVLALL